MKKWQLYINQPTNQPTNQPNNHAIEQLKSLTLINDFPHIILTHTAAAHHTDDSGLDFAPKIISGGVKDKFGNDEGAVEK